MIIVVTSFFVSTHILIIDSHVMEYLFTELVLGEYNMREKTVKMRMCVCGERDVVDGCLKNL